MMLDEGIIVNNTKSLMKSEMIRQIQRLRSADPERWSRAVFEAITQMSFDEVDWSFKDNHAGFYTWVRSFDQLIGELIDDGYVREGEDEVTGHKVLEATKTDPPIEYSYQSYPSS